MSVLAHKRSTSKLEFLHNANNMPWLLFDIVKNITKANSIYPINKWECTRKRRYQTDTSGDLYKNPPNKPSSSFKELLNQQNNKQQLSNISSPKAIPQKNRITNKAIARQLSDYKKKSRSSTR